MCKLCPRMCKDNYSYCGKNDDIIIARAALHYFEEPIISGENGSGTIFFSGCNLRCVYCQNSEISHLRKGEKISIERLAEIFYELEQKKAENINLVTPTIYIDKIIRALNVYKPKIPVVYNSSGYENEASIESLKGCVDVFLPDFKYSSNDIAKKYSDCCNYVEVAIKAIKKMKELCPQDIIENGLIKKGVVIRHLVLPSNLENSIRALDILNEEFGENIIVSLMSQFTPKNVLPKEINRKLKPIEYKIIVKEMEKKGFNGFIQEMSSADLAYIPKFDGDGVNGGK